MSFRLISASQTVLGCTPDRETRNQFYANPSHPSRTALLIAPFLTDSLRSAAAQSTVYQNDFTLGAGTGFAPGISGSWSTTATSFTPSGRYRQLLGEFANQTVSLTLNNLPPHHEVTVSCLFFILKSWDGNQLNDPVSGLPVGPDVWGCYVTDGPKLLTTTFSNINHFTGAGTQALLIWGARELLSHTHQRSAA